MNSFKNLHDGLAYEICRQAEVLEEGGIIYQETRHWDPSKKRTIVMRVKETADDYRLFPEPDLAPYDLSDEFIESVRAKLPELPDEKAKRFEESFGLSAYDARHLVEHRSTSNFFEACMAVAGADAKARFLVKQRRWQNHWLTSLLMMLQLMLMRTIFLICPRRHFRQNVQLSW